MSVNSQIALLIELVNDKIKENTDEKIVLLKEPTVVQWLFGDLSYLPSIEKKNKQLSYFTILPLYNWGRR